MGRTDVTTRDRLPYYCCNMDQYWDEREINVVWPAEGPLQLSLHQTSLESTPPKKPKHRPKSRSMDQADFERCKS